MVMQEVVVEAYRLDRYDNQALVGLSIADAEIGEWSGRLIC